MHQKLYKKIVFLINLIKDIGLMVNHLRGLNTLRGLSVLRGLSGLSGLAGLVMLSDCVMFLAAHIPVKKAACENE